MLLTELLNSLDYKLIKGSLEKQVSDICYDSRKVIDHSMFICIQGFSTDGHLYINDAIKKGADVIIIENEIDPIEEDVTVIEVKDSRKAMAIIANNYYKNPSTEFNLIGITGTNGKTTTSFMTEHILKYAGNKVGLIGTIENHIGDTVIEADRTTPESIELQKLFRDMKSEGADSVVMEVSSHALDLDRVYMTSFDVGVFTNLTLDHLDYHKTMANYLKAKTKLFYMCRYGVLNLDDKSSEYILEKASCEKMFTFSTEDEEATFYAKDIVISAEGTTYTLVCDNIEYNVHLSIPGKFNVYNSLSSIAACYALSIPVEDSVKALGEIEGVKGRFQTILSKKGYSAIVDYAHAPDGLLNVLRSIREFARGRVITVFGCGGDRDRSKRPIMGKIAGENSDYCIITSDNPRTEEPQSIIDEIEKGMLETTCEYKKILNRKEAIQHALSVANKDDVVLVAGKGHENYQIIGKEKTYFDDSMVIKEYLQGE